jgi:hypothetical protein
VGQRSFIRQLIFYETILFFIAFSLVVGKLLAADPVQTLDNGMKVHPKAGAARTIEINVINSRVVRVQASPEINIPFIASKPLQWIPQFMG